MAENIKKMEEFKMANTILIKRGLIKNLSNLTLAEGELALVQKKQHGTLNWTQQVQ